MKRHKDREPLDLHGVMEAAIAEVGGVELAADIMGVRPGWIYDALDPDRADGPKGAKITFAHVRALIRAGARAPVHDLCRLSGGELLAVHSDQAPATIITALARIGRESGEVLAAVSAAVEDGSVTAAEWRLIEKETLDLHAALAALLAMRQRPHAGAPPGPLSDSQR